MDYIFSTADPKIKPIYFVIAIILAFIIKIVTDIYRRQGKITKAQSVASNVLITYIFLVFASTVFSRTPKEHYSYELIPFWSYLQIVKGSKSLFWEDVLNVIMLFPIGVLLPIVIKDGGKSKRFRTVILIGFSTSLTIELLQLFTKRGLFEFDDMIHNTLGVAIGYWCCCALGRSHKDFIKS